MSTAAGGDQILALELYEWNTDTGSSILHDLAHVEVGLRNAYNPVLEEWAHVPSALDNLRGPGGRSGLENKEALGFKGAQ